MHNLPFAALLVIALAAIVAILRSLRRFLNDFFTVSEDYWTWSTKSGEIFEDAEVVTIQAGEVTLRHRNGIARVAMDQLSESSLQLLQRAQASGSFVAAEPVKGAIEPFRKWSHVS